MSGMDRRGFLQAILAAGVAPAFIGASVLMPVKKLWTPPSVLDDYKEGLWTPTFTFSTADGVQYQTGTYRRVGKIVYVTGTVRFPSSSPALA